MITSGVESGSSSLGGQASDQCPCGDNPGNCTNLCFAGSPCSAMENCDGKVHVFDCGPDRTCFTCDDFEVGLPVDKDEHGNFVFHLTEPLQPGQVIYARDDCFDPFLNGVGNGPAWGRPVMLSPVVVPVLSREALVALVAVLSVIGLAGLLRLRRAS